MKDQTASINKTYNGRARRVYLLVLLTFVTSLHYLHLTELQAGERLNFIWRGRMDGMVGDWGVTRKNRVEYEVESGKGYCLISLGW